MCSYVTSTLVIGFCGDVMEVDCYHFNQRFLMKTSGTVNTIAAAVLNVCVCL